MADESGDIEMGYVDDDIELDDEMEDEDLGGSGGVASASTSGVTNPNASGPVAIMRKPKRPQAPKVKKPPVDTSAPQPKDMLLRPGGKANRSLLLARFQCEPPDLKEASKVRLYRQYEGTERGRERGLKRDAAEVRRSETYVGQKRQQRARETGTQLILERDKKNWILEVTPGDVMPSTPPREEGKYAEGTVAYKSKYEGVSSSAHYALMVAHRDGKHVDVVPIGEYSWHSFRRATANLESGKETDRAEAKMKTLKKRNNAKMEKIEMKFEAAAERREGLQGGFSRFEEKRGLQNYGLRRKVNPKIEADKAKTEIGMDYEQEFDNDDVDQIDKEDKTDKTQERVRSRKQLKKEKMELENQLKDLPTTKPKRIAGSEDEAESEAESGSESDPEQTQDIAPKPIAGTTESQAQQVATEDATMKMKPTKENVALAMKMETTDKNRVKARLQDILRHFDRSPTMKKMLIGTIKANTQLTYVMEDGKKVYYVAPKT